MNKILVTLLIAFFLLACGSVNKQSSRQSNIDMAQTFMDDLFVRADLAAVKRAMHSEFTFTYMGNIENVGGIDHGIESFFGNHVPLVGELLPDGIVLTTVDVIADDAGVALIMIGDAKGINGEYDNKYDFTFKMKEGLISEVKEYNSDLLVATRLYKNQLASID